MKKRLIFLVAVVLFASIFVLSGCSALKATDTAKEMLGQYYEYYNDEEIDECIDLFHETLIEDIGDEDTAEVIFNSRRYILGEVEDYEVISFDSDSNFSEAEVVLEVETEYENADEVIKEQYIIYFEDGVGRINGIDVGTDPVAGELVDGYFEKYYDMVHVKKYYIPYVVNSPELFSESSVKTLADQAFASGGEYKGYEMTDYTYYYDKLDWTDTTYFLAQIDAELEFENEDFVLYAEISKEDKDVAFNYLEYYPLSAYEVIKEYFNYESKGQTDKILAMYAPGFFENSDVTAQDWETSILQLVTTGYGEFIEYNIYSWEYSTITFNNSDYDVYTFAVESVYENAVFDEYIVVIKGETSQAILGHSIQ